MQKYHLLAFGDSLTEGYYNWGTKFNPYTETLDKLLKEEFGDIFEITTAGVAGERTGQMKTRLRAMIEIFRAKGVSFLLCIFLGGTNDIGTYGMSGSSIWDNFEEIYRMLEEYNIVIVPITIPQSAFDMDWYLSKRTYLNDQIKTRHRERHPNVPVIDLEALIPFSKESGYWDDSLHLNHRGYDLMGEHVFSSLKSFLANIIAQ